MEIALAILLFFGGLTLGSVHTHNSAAAPQQESTVPGKTDTAVAPAARLPEPSPVSPPCSHQVVIYRDLTLAGPGRGASCVEGCIDE